MGKTLLGPYRGFLLDYLLRPLGGGAHLSTIMPVWNPILSNTSRGPQLARLTARRRHFPATFSQLWRIELLCAQPRCTPNSPNSIIEWPSSLRPKRNTLLPTLSSVALVTSQTAAVQLQRGLEKRDCSLTGHRGAFVVKNTAKDSLPSDGTSQGI